MSPIAFHPAVSTGSSGQTSNSDGSSPSAVTPANISAEKNMFLQLLVAQLKNQDPLNPVQGTEFVTQLAQFQQLEQSLNTGEDVSAIRADLDQLAALSATSSTGQGTHASQS